LLLPPLTLSAGLQTLKGRFIFRGPNLSGFFSDFFRFQKCHVMDDLGDENKFYASNFSFGSWKNIELLPINRSHLNIQVVSLSSSQHISTIQH